MNHDETWQILLMKNSNCIMIKFIMMRIMTTIMMNPITAQTKTHPIPRFVRDRTLSHRTWHMTGGLGEPPAGFRWINETVPWVKTCWVGNHIELHVLPRNLTWNLKMMVSKRNRLFQGLLFRFHVKFQGCIDRNRETQRKRRRERAYTIIFITWWYVNI